LLSVRVCTLSISMPAVSLEITAVTKHMTAFISGWCLLSWPNHCTCPSWSPLVLSCHWFS